jgi:hypothetical protein
LVPSVSRCTTVYPGHMRAGAGHESDDGLILDWWNGAHGEHADAVTPEMAQAYTRRLAHAEALRLFDAHLARVLTPYEWAYLTTHLPPTAPPLRPPTSDDDAD